MKTRLSAPYGRTARSLYRYLDTPRALTCFLLVEHREWDQLAALGVDPHHYIDSPSGVEKYRRDAQATDFLRKSQDLPTSPKGRKAAAEASFMQCELQCAETNYFLEHLQILGDRNDRFGRALLTVLSKARKKIRAVLGAVPPRLEGRFGPGTCYELQGSTFSTLADKLWQTPHVTREAYAVWRHTVDGSIFERQRLELGLPDHALCRGNRFTTVPKTSRTDRGICIEPLGNLYCQLGVGGYLKERLALHGLFIQRDNTPLCPIKELLFRPRPNGQKIHNNLAQRASRDGSWATIDLSNASDTVAYQLVKLLFPTAWFQLLVALRSPFTRFKGKWVKLEKFSSMGNGFTFEVETLIFAALSAAVADLTFGEDLFVYGDDIIVPSNASKNVLAILTSVGFTPNQTKTYVTGLFRESCGGDFFCGEDVRSVFSKAEPSNPLEWIALHNELRKKFPRASVTLRHIVDQVPATFRLFGPSRAGDVVFHTRNRSRFRTFQRDGIDYLRTVIRKERPIPLDRWGQEFTVSLALLGVSSKGLCPRHNAEGSQSVTFEEGTLSIS